MRAYATRGAVIGEPFACRATRVDGLGTFTQQRCTLYLTPRRPSRPQQWRLPRTRRVVHLVA